jgi:hypothetical protein
MHRCKHGSDSGELRVVLSAWSWWADEWMHACMDGAVLMMRQARWLYGWFYVSGGLPSILLAQDGTSICSISSSVGQCACHSCTLKSKHT